MKIAGLDIGIIGCKLTVFDENGIQFGKAYRDYPVHRQVNGHEIDILANSQRTAENQLLQLYVPGWHQRCQETVGKRRCDLLP